MPIKIQLNHFGIGGLPQHICAQMDTMFLDYIRLRFTEVISSNKYEISSRGKRRPLTPFDIFVHYQLNPSTRQMAVQFVYFNDINAGQSSIRNGNITCKSYQIISL